MLRFRFAPLDARIVASAANVLGKHMISKPIPLFINPTAARGRARRRLATIESLFTDAGVNIDVHHSVARGDMEHQVRAVIDQGADKIIVAGGGTGTMTRRQVGISRVIRLDWMGG